MPWDIINMTSTYLSVQATTTNQTACQAACSADLKCQYYVWYNYTVSGNGDDQCYLRLATANITKISGFDSATSTDIILFEVRCALEGRMAGNASAFPPRARLSLPTRTPSWCSSLPPLRALHIEGLPLSMTASRLSELMSVYGPVQYAEVRKAVMVLWWAWMEGGGLCWRRGHGTCLRFPHWGGSGSSRQARTAAAYAGSFTAPPRTPPRRPRQRL